MRLNLSSQIAFNKVPEEYYHPRSAVERSELTRREKIPTDIFPKMEEGAQAIVDAVEKLIKQRTATEECVCSDWERVPRSLLSTRKW